MMRAGLDTGYPESLIASGRSGEPTCDRGTGALPAWACVSIHAAASLWTL